VVVEANSVGTPAVGYDVPGIRDSIRSQQTGLLVAPGDPGALGNGALELVKASTQYAALCSRAIKWSTQFSWQATATQLMLIMEAAVAPSDSEAIASCNGWALQTIGADAGGPS
jgi:glycosyltransferase involved in cell wall biosynthesis